MKKFYYLPSCSTCTRIKKELGIQDNWELIDIKKEPITSAVLDDIKKQMGSYEAFFSKKAIKYTSLGLKNKNLSETDFKNYMLSDYTFLQRPIVEIDGTYYVGNSKRVQEEVAFVLNQS